MKAGHVSPGNAFLLALLLAIVVVAAVTAQALRQPWLGLKLTWDETREAAIVLHSRGPAASIPVGTALVSLQREEGPPMPLDAIDFTIEPDAALPSLSVYDDFLSRQGALSNLLQGSALILHDHQGNTHELKPAVSRPLSTLPADYWVQVTVGFLAWLIAASVWIFRRNETSARYLLLSGFSTLLFTTCAAVYTTRELALPALQFRWLSDLNFLGGALYCATMVALLWYYPRRLGRFPLGPVLVATYVLWWLVQELHFVDSMLVARRSLVFAALLVTFALAFIQWVNTRRDPVARAALQWFLLSWLVGISLFSLLNFVPQLFGMATGSLQGYSFLLFLLVYGGLAFGILRFRLFELGDWWFRILTWIAGVLLLLLLDVAFLWGLNLSSSLSLGLALLLCGLLWLPFRGWLWDRLMQRYRPTEQNLFNQILAVAFASNAEERTSRWSALARQLFDPLQIIPLDENQTDVSITRDGLEMTLPGLHPLPCLKLEYAGGGRRLFTPRDRALAEQMLEMLRHANESRDAYNKGVREERSRIARDLHDDIGSSLLTALHHTDLEQSKAAVSQGMMEMQTIIRGLTGQHMPLEDMIGELRHETFERVELAGITLDWPLEACDNHRQEVGYGIYKNYLSLMRELTANIIRHAGATRIRISVSCHEGRLLSVIENDGRPFDGKAPENSQGHGLRNLEKRLQELGGKLSYSPTSYDTQATLSIPLEPAP